MYISPLCLLLVGATLCLSVQIPPSDAKKHDVDKEAMEKVIAEALGLKKVPSPIKGSKKKVLKYILYSLRKHPVNETEASGNSEAGDTSARTTDSLCSRHDWSLSLSSVSSSIIQPVEPVNLHYCSGSCHTISQTIDSSLRAKLQAMDTSVPAPCCTPIRYSGISVVYVDPLKGEQVTGELENFNVEECGCR